MHIKRASDQVKCHQARPDERERERMCVCERERARVNLEEKETSRD